MYLGNVFSSSAREVHHRIRRFSISSLLNSKLPNAQGHIESAHLLLNYASPPTQLSLRIHQRAV